MQIFAEFDSNGDGNIDKDEMSIGCRKLGVIITEAELDLIWPYFDTDDSGEVDFGEFWEFIQKSGAKGAAHRARAKELHETELKTSVKLRRRRIRQKTRYVGAKETQVMPSLTRACLRALLLIHQLWHSHAGADR